MLPSPVIIKAAAVLPVKEGLKAQGGAAFDAVLKATIDQKLNPIGSASPIGPASPAGPRGPADSTKPSPVQHVIASMTKSENRLQALVDKGLSGTSMPPEKLLALQASVYQATLEIDVVSKGVEQSTSGIKTLLQSQI